MRLEAISSTSSMKTTTFSRSFTVLKVSRKPAARPAGSPASLDGKISTKGQSRREATAFAKVVFPVPGGPNSTIARGGSTPNASARAASESGKTRRRSRSSFSAFIPAIFDQRSRASRRPPRSLRISRSCSLIDTSRSKYLRFFSGEKPTFSSTPLLPSSATSIETLVMPELAMSISSSPSRRPPMP